MRDDWRKWEDNETGAAETTEPEPEGIVVNWTNGFEPSPDEESDESNPPSEWSGEEY